MEFQREKSRQAGQATDCHTSGHRSKDISAADQEPYHHAGGNSRKETQAQAVQPRTEEPPLAVVPKEDEKHGLQGQDCPGEQNAAPQGPRSRAHSERRREGGQDRKP